MFMDVKEAEELIVLKNAIERLKNNRDFKKVITLQYNEKEAARLAKALANPEMQEDIDQRIIKEKLAAIGHLDAWLDTKVKLGNQIEQELKEVEKEKNKADIEEPEVDEITGEELGAE